MTQESPIAFVAGASRGLGLLIARELGRRGFRLVICSRTEAELRRAAERLRTDGYDVEAYVCDVTDNAAVIERTLRIEQEVGQIEVLICVAGIIQVGPLGALERWHFTSAVDTMLWGPVNTALAVVPHMQQRGRGRIGIITSVGGLISAPHLLPYSTAKFGAVGFSRGLRSELSGSGVSVTTVAPGLMRTGSHLRAKFVGDHAREFAWFAAAASLPLLSIDAERAAVKIVRGILQGKSVVSFTPMAQVAPRVDALFPNLTSHLLGLTARLLPSAPEDSGSSTTLDGWQAARLLRPRSRAVVGAITGLGRRAARRFNEIPKER
jgi:short-subunit dehydrogenase